MSLIIFQLVVTKAIDYENETMVKLITIDLFFNFRTASPILNMTSNKIPSNWDYEKGYDEPGSTEPYPYRVFGKKNYSILLNIQ